MDRLSRIGGTLSAQVLIVDTPYAAPLVRKLLDTGFETTCATSWAEAVRSLEEKRPEIALLGYHFDETRPYRFIQHLRNDPLTKHIPVLLVRGTGVQQGPYVDEEIGESYKDLGANGYVAIDKSAACASASTESDRLVRIVRELMQNASASPRDAHETDTLG